MTNVNPRSRRLVVRAMLALALIAAAESAFAERDERPLQKGGYLAPLYGYVDSQSDRLKSGAQVLVMGGYRSGGYAIEIGGIMQQIDTEADSNVDLKGGLFNALWFPFDGLLNLYGMASFGAGELMDYPATPRSSVDNPLKRFSLTRYGGGLGYLWGLSLGRYEMAIRSEVLYIVGRRDEDPRPGGDIGAPRLFKEVSANIGLQLPLGLVPPAPPPQPVAQVVAPLPDSDGDGIFDNADQCPGTPRGTEVDSVGCPLPPEPPPPACHGNSDDRSIALGGCEAGDTLVLRDVNFEVDEDRLTADAEAVLDEVVAELQAHPDFVIEVAGHTDDKGSESYNQSLSERRARSVVSYLVSRGIPQSRLTAVGYGESQPIADNQTEEGRERNRRVELKILRRDDSQPRPQTAAPASPAAVDGGDATRSPAVVESAPASAPKSEGEGELEFLLN
ncbi:OmpA family protein [Sinimarinibacterium thermocellulolyticum]